MSALLRDLPPLLAAHLALALTALLLASLISFPLALAATDRPRLAAVALTIAGVVQTVPGLALLALMVPVLARLHLFSPFGFPPAVIALTLYALLPLLRNGITGLRGVDPAIVEAARGMGMSSRQILRKVRLPLAAPVIAAGVRTATVWTVGAATLATPVGQACLGNDIFTGLQTRNFTMLFVGVAASAGLALTLDAILAAAERALSGRHRRGVLIPAAALVIFTIVVIAILPRVVGSGSATAATRTDRTASTAITHVRIGGKTFTEQYVLVELLKSRLTAAGVGVEVAQSLGSTVIFDALTTGEVDAYVDYSGTLWTTIMRRPAGAPRWRVLDELGGWLVHEHGVRSLGSLGFENAYALAVRRETAERLHLHSLADLAAHGAELSVGADYEFLGRPEWASVQSAYGIHVARTTTFDPALLYEAISHKDVDVISAFSSDGRITANDLVVLEDPRGALPPYDAMILLGPRVADDPRIACVLGALHISVDLMRRTNALVDQSGQTPAAAAAWLDGQLGRAPDCASVSP